MPKKPFIFVVEISKIVFYCGNSFLKNKIIVWHPSDEPENVQWY